MVEVANDPVVEFGYRMLLKLQPSCPVATAPLGAVA